MKSTLFLSLALLLFTSGCPFVGPGESLPEPDDCSSPRALDGIESVEVGRIEGDEFVAWQDGETVDVTQGSQGGDMIGVVLSVRGSDLPTCMAHFMRIDTAEVEGLAYTNHLVNTYTGPGGTRITKTIWLIFQGYPEPLPGDPVELTVQIGDLELQRTLVIGS